MGLNVDTIAVIKALDEATGRSISYSEIRHTFQHYGGTRRALAETLERVVARYPECVEWDMRIGHGRMLEVWVRVKRQIGPV
jgi:hypothetical protein